MTVVYRGNEDMDDGYSRCAIGDRSKGRFKQSDYVAPSMSTSTGCCKQLVGRRLIDAFEARHGGQLSREIEEEEM